VGQERCLEFIVDGIVQGVGFRYFTARECQRLGVRGYVRNEADGKVKVVVVGTDEILAQVESLLRQGPRHSRVESLKRRELSMENFESFDVRF
jgi:acylphosphatase